MSARHFAVAVLVLIAVGAVAGVVWQWLWTPPLGGLVDGVWVPRDEDSLRQAFSATGWYVAVGSIAGLVGGGLVALFLDRRPIATLVGVTVGSALAGLVMYAVGTALGPADPVDVAGAAADAALPAALEVSGGTPFLAVPAGALVALTMAFLGLAARERVRDHAGAEPDPVAGVSSEVRPG